jgi:hypothetical protein
MSEPVPVIHGDHCDILRGLEQYKADNPEFAHAIQPLIDRIEADAAEKATHGRILTRD